MKHTDTQKVLLAEEFYSFTITKVVAREMVVYLNFDLKCFHD